MKFVGSNNVCAMTSWVIQVKCQTKLIVVINSAKEKKIDIQLTINKKMIFI